MVDALKPADKPFRLFDSEVKGFSVRVGPSGDKRWQLDYRPDPGGRSTPKKRLTIAVVGVLTPDEARARAKAMLAEIAKGNDPGADRIAARSERTVADLIDLYEEKGCRRLRGKRRGQPMKPRNKRYTINALRHHVVPLIGKERASTITIAMIDDMASAITAGKTAKERSRAGQAYHRQRRAGRLASGAALPVGRLHLCHRPRVRRATPYKKRPWTRLIIVARDFWTWTRFAALAGRSMSWRPRAPTRRRSIWFGCGH